ncbi:methylase of chemotaxis methyl-accepting protein [Desulfosporosinus orientis DSM 765]|uniref:Methylase of chemotaxis methyl-accepting protein n=1 Tax=Desulfosporosinus orientis (strain ATCC 19365 / DSM 765 / NCIMB 8382 / VKM B-1628 / Singapore I) TaxID=768706 RepID=G7WI26_DESOD|nr:protein-glutamate O-methyltransferase CheR [Desulfosporosinus orientis]AET70323.1 methylase of chemotaxis methyl-accepting protein [Desulfosporosinus orientis DSM 765]
MSKITIANTYEDFIKGFHPKSGLDLKFYKQNQMQRRILSFMNSHGHATFPEFLNALNVDSVLYDAFFKHLTINVSQFFRDANQWKTLRESIIPLLLQSKSPLKLWSAGCSSGQEPYSLAMTLMEYFPTAKFSILATDIDVNVLKQAKEGFYKQNDFASTPPEFLQKYFTPTDKGHQIKDSVQRNVTFQHQNLLTDHFQTGLDFIACRNVVIYFTEEAKEMLYKKFTDSLRPGGILFTGSTEHLFGLGHLGLKPVSSFFYQKQ